MLIVVKNWLNSNIVKTDKRWNFHPVSWVNMKHEERFTIDYVKGGTVSDL